MDLIKQETQETTVVTTSGCGWQQLYLKNSKGEYYKTHENGKLITTNSLSDALIFDDEDCMIDFFLNMKEFMPDEEKQLDDFTLYTYPQGEKY
jgi:hypothetical protein